jgi:hypothetical protein
MLNVSVPAMRYSLKVFFLASLFFYGSLLAQGVTTASMSGSVVDQGGAPLAGAEVIAVHEPSGTRYGASTRDNGQYNIHNMRVGGPYSVTTSYLGYGDRIQTELYLRLGQDSDVDFTLSEEAVAGQEVTVVGEVDEILNSGRTGAASYINADQVNEMPSIQRSTRDLIRLDPRNDGNYSFGGRNWLFNSISLDGSYFNNSFGLDDPAPGGQTAAEPVPYDAVEQVQVSVAPYDVREGGFTGAGINTVTKSGTNQLRASLYAFGRNESFVGNKVSGNEVIANPDLAFAQYGFTASGAVIPNKLFFFISGEAVRRDDPGTNFVASRGGATGPGISRVKAEDLDAISQRMKEEYGYDTGPYEGFIHEINNEKLLAKLDWNINDQHNLTFRYNRLDAGRDLPPHPFAISYNGTGRGPNENSLPFQNSGYKINNQLNSYVLELKSQSTRFANRFFVSYNRFRDFREPFSVPYPTIEIGQDGVTYTTVGHEPFSIHNILDQDVWQITDNFSYYTGNHVLTFGANFESFTFFNSFNLFRNGFFGFANAYDPVDDFLAATDPLNPDQVQFDELVGSGPFKGENIDLGQFAVYAQDEFHVSDKVDLTYGLRVDFPLYLTEPIDNPFSRALELLDGDGNPEKIDQSKLPGATPLWSPRVGFNWNVTGDRATQLRGGSGIFTGRLPFVWLGNVISNPGLNPNIYPGAPPVLTSSKDSTVLQQTFDMNAMVEDFKWPQVWTSNIAVDHQLPWDILGTAEFIYSKDINAVFMRNANLSAPTNTLADGRLFYGGGGLNSEVIVNGDTTDYSGAGVYLLDNTSEGWNYNFTLQLRKVFPNGIYTMFGYSYLQARNLLKSTEIAFTWWTETPVQSNPNKPNLSYSEFGLRNRIFGAANFKKQWSRSVGTSFGFFVEVAEGNRFAGAGGNRYSFIYSGDVNGDGTGANDLIYIPRSMSEINFMPYDDENGNTVTAADQWSQFNALVEQDSYLSSHRGQIAERFGLVNEWWWNIDLRILQDFSLFSGNTKHTFQISLDLLNLPNLLNSSWGVRKVANSAATSPLTLDSFNSEGEPVFRYTGPPDGTFIDDPGLNSRWQIQLGLRYLFN